MAKRINDLDPDGVRIIVPWEELRVGGSVFVPCINTEACERQVQGVAKRLGISLTCRKRIEAPYLGLRIWRAT
jgi:hypothetical protein